MANNYQITIQLDNATLNVLQNGWALHIFKAVKATGSLAKPTVWAAITQFSNYVTISWTGQCGGYVSKQQIKNGLVVDVGNNKSVNLGNVMTLNTDGSTALTTAGGTPGAITIISLENNEWLCGMTQSVNGGAPSAICACPLYGQTSYLMEPFEKIVLMFASSIAPGTVLEKAINQVACITLLEDSTQATLSFEVNKGWDTGGATNVGILPPQSNLAEALIGALTDTPCGKSAKNESILNK